MATLFKFDELVFVPIPGSRVTQIEIGKRYGRLYDTNQLEFPLNVTHVRFLDDYAFDEYVRLISRGADRSWLQNANFWNGLSAAKLVNFQGEFERKVLNELVSKCKNARRLSFTYWNAHSATEVLRSITSVQLLELTMDVSGTKSNDHDVFHSLAALGNRSNAMMKRLVLIFDDPLLYDPVSSYQLDKKLNSLFDGGGLVYLFYYESQDDCMHLILKEYTDNGYIQMVRNNCEYRDETEIKLTDRYRVFCKSEGGFTFFVCCRRSGPRSICSNTSKAGALNCSDFCSSNASSSSSSSTGTTNSDDIAVQRMCEGYPYDAAAENFTMPEKLTGDELAAGINANNLNGDAVFLSPDNALRNCCFLVTRPCREPYNEFNAPVFDKTMIRSVIFFERKTHYFTSNGIYFLLNDMGMEADFMKHMAKGCADRFTFMCTSHERRYVVTKHMAEFFTEIQSVEFVGNWYSPPLEAILEHLPKNIKSIAFMNVKLARKPLIHLTAAFKRGILPLDGFFYDSRDTIEMSLASIFHGMSNDNSQIQNLSNLVLIARSVSDPPPNGYRTTITGFLNDLVLVTQEGAKITVIVCDENVKAHVLLNQGFADNGNVIVPAMFSNRLYEVDSFPYMRRFTSFTLNRAWCVVIPAECK